MKVLFLDNDGVICLANNWGSRVKKRKKDKISLVMNDPDVEAKYRFVYFDKKAVKVLNQVLEEIDVLNSDSWVRLLVLFLFFKTISWSQHERCGLGVYY